jgi:hypothetical protein
MATALKVNVPPIQPATTCEHDDLNVYERIGGGLDPQTLERGRCIACGEWVEIETDAMTQSVDMRVLDSATIARLRKEAMES